MKTLKYNRSRLTTYFILFTLLLSILLTSFNPTAYAGVPSLDNIRVALFIDSGKYYRGVVPTVTLVSANGLDVALKDNAGSLPLISIAGGTSARFGTDQFTLQVLETADKNAALLAYNNLKLKKYPATIVAHGQSDKPWYQVVTNSYSTLEGAYAAAPKLTTDTGLAVTVEGSLRWSAGVFNNEQDAQAIIRRLEANQFPAYLTLSYVNRVKQAQVFVGDEGTAEDLNALRDRIKSVLPDIALTPIDAAMPYLLTKREVSEQGPELSHFYFNAAGETVKVTPAAGNTAVPVIQVIERYGRTYRGTIELSNFKGNMAVINELPFEQYLYGVVSSEMAGGWPQESLKAQAVAARTFALGLGVKYTIAHVSDTVYEQAYKGFSIEKPDVVQAVDATKGQVLMYQDRLISPYFYSNAGGVTADSSEVWGGIVPYLKSVTSPDDFIAKAAPVWFRIMLIADGTVGYVSSDYAQDLVTKHTSGFSYVQINSPVNFRKGPGTETELIRSIGPADNAILLEKLPQNTSYSWVTNPVTGEQLMQTIMAKTTTKLSAPIQSLKVTMRGPSGRATEVQADGLPIAVTSPDGLRTALGGLRSTLFDIEEMGSYTIIGANGASIQAPTDAPGSSLAVMGADGLVDSSINGVNDSFFILNGKGKTRVATKSVQFRFVGKGYGHGLGMSQYGAKALAQSGYGYAQILKHYYTNDVVLTPVIQ